MMGSGGLVVMDETSCMVDIARFFMDFTQAESCGKCTPCRVGTRRILEMLQKICDGKGEEGDIEKLEDLCYEVSRNSLCGLGQGAPIPVISTLKNFRHEYEAHIYEKRCPAKVCKPLIRMEIQPSCTVVWSVPATARSKRSPANAARFITSIRRPASAAASACRFVTSMPLLLNLERDEKPLTEV